MKYTTSTSKVKSFDIGRGNDNPDRGSLTDEQGGQKVDPSVRLSPLRGEPIGTVPLERTMQKPMAYKEKAGPR